MNSGRILIFIVAYEAQRHLASVLSRIPTEYVNAPEIDILVIDDGSSDQGADVGRVWAQEHDCRNLTVLRNPVNQGYGGNQKLGYRIAIDAGYDFVILLHGDGQYAPELLPEFINAWRTQQPDVVLGSRMKSLRSAREGGMPWHKMIGNRLLTAFQNAMASQQISEYHTGYRGYSTQFLNHVPFEINTNDFHFDTEILLQAFHTQAKIHEFAIPTHYGEEICRVNGVRYAKDVILATLQYKLHRFGMLCDLKYRRTEIVRYEDKTFMAYSSHATAMRIIKEKMPRRLLDLGCGPGFVVKRCEQMGIKATGVDIAPPLPGMVSDFRQSNLETDPTPADAMSFDMILMLDIIEHLAEPERFLLDLRNRSEPVPAGTPAPTVVISTPNVAFAAIRLNLALGRFSYAERGILDITHKRLFTRKTLVSMLRQCGYEVQQVLPIGVPFQAVTRSSAGKWLGRMATLMARIWPTMFAFQFIVICTPRPGVQQLLRSSQRHQVVGGRIADAIGPSLGPKAQ